MTGTDIKQIGLYFDCKPLHFHDILDCHQSVNQSVLYSEPIPQFKNRNLMFTTLFCSNIIILTLKMPTNISLSFLSNSFPKPETVKYNPGLRAVMD